MAIDLCNKSPGSLADRDPGSWADAVQEPALLEDLGTEQRDALNFAYRTTLSNVDPRFVAGDPAAWASDFGYALDRVAIRLDNRSNDELRHEALNHPDPSMREQALYEYADRDHADAIELLEQAVRHDKNREVRWDALWAIEKLGGPEAIATLQKFLTDADPEIAEWSKLFISELQTGDPSFDARAGAFTPGRTFDETIYLLIHCDLYVRLDESNTHWGKISLAPQGLAFPARLSLRRSSRREARTSKASRRCPPLPPHPRPSPRPSRPSKRARPLRQTARRIHQRSPRVRTALRPPRHRRRRIPRKPQTDRTPGTANRSAPAA